MEKLFSHPRFVHLLAENDQKNSSLGLDEIKEIIYNSGHFKSAGLWDDNLLRYIFDTCPTQMPHLSWITEKYYASKLRQFSNTEIFDFFYIVGYARVISLRMRYNQKMGLTQDDLDFVTQMLEKYYSHSSEKVSVLEIGCGTGELLSELYTKGYPQVEGIDMSPTAIRLAKRRFRKYHIPSQYLHCLSLDDFYQTFPDKQYDVVVHADVIEHVAPYRTLDFLSTIYHLIKPQGYMIVMTPSKLTGPHDDTRLFEPPGTQPQGFHLQEFLLDDLKKVLSKAGFGYFETVSSLPSLNRYWDSISSENFSYKIDLEKKLISTEWRLKKSIVDGMYFKGLVCQKV
jgi:2-polyprenyl-3-methyl-5-hydroxy-6-metoxy-1,4-benzoquinol methylase